MGWGWGYSGQGVGWGPGYSGGWGEGQRRVVMRVRGSTMGVGAWGSVRSGSMGQ